MKEKLYIKGVALTLIYILQLGFSGASDPTQETPHNLHTNETIAAADSLYPQNITTGENVSSVDVMKHGTVTESSTVTVVPGVRAAESRGDSEPTPALVKLTSSLSPPSSSASQTLITTTVFTSSSTISPLPSKTSSKSSLNATPSIPARTVLYTPVMTSPASVFMVESTSRRNVAQGNTTDMDGNEIKSTTLSPSTSSSESEIISAKLDRITTILIVFCVTVAVLLIICLVLVGTYMAVMSRRYRDISNELFTMRKMKVHRRISRRETQRELGEIKINLEPPGRRLRHTQSVHGYVDKPPRPPSYDMVDRPRSFLVDRPTPPIDPNNYIICKPNSVSSNRSPSRASESDTVQSEC